MFSLVCDCGYKVEDKDRYVVEARMWKHALSKHFDMIKAMSELQIVEWLKNKDATLVKQAK